MAKVKIRISQDTYELLIKLKGYMMAEKGRNVENDEAIYKAIIKKISDYNESWDAPENPY